MSNSKQLKLICFSMRLQFQVEPLKFINLWMISARLLAKISSCLYGIIWSDDYNSFNIITLYQLSIVRAPFSISVEFDRWSGSALYGNSESEDEIKIRCEARIIRSTLNLTNGKWSVCGMLKWSAPIKLRIFFRKIWLMNTRTLSLISVDLQVQSKH